MKEMHDWLSRISEIPIRNSDLSCSRRRLFARLEDGLVRFEIGDDVWAITLDGSANNVTNILKRAHERGAPDLELDPATLNVASLPNRRYSPMDGAVPRASMLPDSGPLW